ncbi:RagB/SusD family nutrient uptake outer membrane protein [Chitinophaga qingshengii]|uniref:RagB/SusD family nutrient uptake outer membrane protein n=1 Tax=Chitinophaga qingshengii TaxID=1569794 RepID=A0ABR7TUQ9_9BACT|nr:RagB/SusD family nutrient uptake outer membrane protein [Chitinophaga qingshengii]MBC9934193.1 RagB/SusD family nutrient uptake outer membrane protein [Chitinophaga qingshengii]
MKRIFLLIVPGMMLSSCNKFLEVKPKGVIIASTINDYEAILNDMTIVNVFNGKSPLLATDDLTDQTQSPQNQISLDANLYFWNPYINSTPEKPEIWLDAYQRIASLNVITEGVMQAENGTEQKKKALYAEALVSKAYCYMHLLSFFSPAYDPKTASKVYGVPYMVSTDISAPTPPRLTLGESCQQLVKDLQAAIPDLPETNVNTTRVTVAAAYALLSRLYLYMQDYPQALKYADLVIAAKSVRMLDYNKFLGNALPASNISPDEVFVRYTANLQFKYSADLLQQYDTTADLRIRFFAVRNVAGNPAMMSYNSARTYIPNRGITYAEVLLTKAECLARQGSINAALEIVNEDIRKNRFTPAKYQPLSASTTEEAITAVLGERRRELAFKGMRWMDMKRLDQDKRMPAVKRIAANGSTLVTLEPGSLRYTYQIPLQVQQFNPTMPLNKQ